jgi:hypothetical protein
VSGTRTTQASMGKDKNLLKFCSIEILFSSGEIFSVPFKYCSVLACFSSFKLKIDEIHRAVQVK